MAQHDELIGRRVRYRHHIGRPEAYEVEGHVVGIQDANVVDVETLQERPALRMVMLCDDGRLIMTDAMADMTGEAPKEDVVNG